MQAWAFKSVGDDRDWQSNDGYPDVHGSQYAYNNKVGNSQRVTVGDVVVVHDRRAVHGISRIEEIKIEPDVKVRIRRCPSCRKTGAGFRKSMSPMYLCGRCRHEFDDPFVEYESRTVYTACYETEWRPIDGNVTAAALQTVLLVDDKQSAIRAVDPDKLADLLGEAVDNPKPLEVVQRRRAEEIPPTNAVPSKPIAGGREKRMVTVRKNQGPFRRAVMRRDGLVCAITGPAPSSALQAAHLRAYAVHETHNPEEGLMLRTDIHALFDAGLLAVDPTTMCVEASPELRHYPDYWNLRGTEVKSGPWKAALADHFAAASEAWPPSPEAE
ncbi:HNH endonuclease [Nocardia higoensis]|uniref:HNH endonuclease n=1 Tax=Nocardia higoensis TaxID=228599 RepID=A0ABS0DC52_9NOCA|nr:HNH endonuclease signature motif containing protein [Nocardia higoensis]MBF6356063.1 HNH endonuclease [Nocardia higoensis]